MSVSHVAAYQVIHHLRMRMAARLARLPLGYFSRRRSGEIQKVMVDDAARLELFGAHAVPELVSAVAIWLAATVWLLAVDWRMGLAAIAVVPVAFVLLRLALRAGSAHMAKVSAALGRMNGEIVEFLGGLPVVKVFDRSERVSRQIHESIDDYARFETDWARAYFPLGTAFDVLVAANVAVIVPVGLWLVRSGGITVATLLFFFILGIGYSVPLVRFYHLGFNFAFMTYAAGVVAKVLDATALEDSGRLAPRRLLGRVPGGVLRL